MESFTLRLTDGATVAGIANIPSTCTSGDNSRPLLVAIHGAGYSAQYFDSDPEHSAKKLSDAMNIPLFAIDRPGYGGSSPVGHIPQDSTFAEENARRLHHHILPALWTRFGASSGCVCIVLHCHSLGTPSAIIAATLHADDPNPGYPLGGISFSGMGSQSHPDILAFRSRQRRGETNAETLQDLMLPSWAADADIFHLASSLRQHPPTGDIETASQVWAPRWRSDWAPRVQVSVMVGLAERDRVWKGSREHLQEIVSAFTDSPRVQEVLLVGAPHNVEMSHWSRGWYARVFGFAIDCATSFAVKEP